MKIFTSKIGFVTLFLVIAAFVTQMFVVMPSGSHRCLSNQCGIFYWGAHEHDSVWHLALINTGTMQMPVYAGATLTGYNALLDQILSAGAHLGIDSSLLFFRVVPVIWFLAFVLVLRQYTRAHRTNEWYYPSLLFFVFFGGSFSYLLTWYHLHTLIGSSSVLSMQSGLMLTNIQFALSLPLMTWLLILLGVERKSWKIRILIPLIVFSLIGLKFYAGIIAGILVITSYFVRIKKFGLTPIFVDVLVLGIVSLLSLRLFYHFDFGSTTNGILSWTPFATINPIIEEKDLFYLPRLALARYARDNNLFNPIVGVIELVTLLVFIIFNFGTRLIGLFTWLSKALHKKLTYTDVYLSVGIVAAVLLTLLYSQRGEWWNTIQFVYYAFFFASFFAAEQLSTWIASQGMWAKIVVCSVVIATLPNSWDAFRLFSSPIPTSYIPDTELRILSTLRQQPQGTVLALPLITGAPYAQTGIPTLSLTHDTAYVAAYSGKPTYLNDLVQLRLTGIDYTNRLDRVTRGDCSILDSVSYVYIAGQPLPQQYFTCPRTLEYIESDEGATLYRVK